MKPVKLTALLAAGLLAAAGTAAQAQTVLTMSNWVPPQHPIVIYIMQPWADQVAKVTSGRVKVQMLPKAIAAPNQHYDATINGQVDLAWATYGYQPERFQPYLIAELPQLGETAVHNGVALWRTHKKFIEQSGIHKDVQLLGVMTHGPGLFHHSKKHILAPEDLQGQKMRVGGDVPKTIVESFGGEIGNQAITGIHWHSDALHELTGAADEFSRTHIYLDDTSALTMMALRSRARRQKAKTGLDLVVVDYLQLLSFPKSESRQQEISNISRSLKALARELDVPVIALAQLSRQVELRDPPRPQLAGAYRSSPPCERTIPYDTGSPRPVPSFASSCKVSARPPSSHIARSRARLSPITRSRASRSSISTIITGTWLIPSERHAFIR